VAILAFAGTAHADELSDIQAQAKQLREQMTKRIADLEKRQKALEAQKTAVPTISPVDAMAADLPYKAAVKAKPPENDDICIKGICVYGNFDMGATYIQHSAPFAGTAGGPLDTLVSRNGGMGPYFGVGANQLSTSFIGLRGKQEIGDDLYAVFNLQTLFNPASGMNASGTGSIFQNNGLPFNNQQNSFGDSSKGGQMFNNAAYFGISSTTYGTFTMGRQSALTSDLIVNYDPLSGSNSWSVITFQGANGGGGDTENRIFDNAFEYRVNIGPVRLAAEVQAGNGGNSGTGNAFEGNIGFDYLGFSMDFVGGKILDAISAAPLGGVGVGVVPTVAIGNGQLAATVSDNTVFSVGARYAIGPWKFWAGYEHIDYSNPNNPLNPGAFLQGGLIAGQVNNAAFPSDKILQTVWAGVRYSITPALDITGAYYHEWDNTFATAPGILAGCAALGSSSTQCAGTLDAVSVVVDWRFAKHVDVYAGVMYSQVTGGLASNFIVNNIGTTVQAVGANRSSNFDPGVGLRYQF
jgi:predicted porin